ncbi:MAG: N4-gp56 family major capsid protein, partial [Anoxybacillus gonensis]|nr:N4-gp56 family major capsid protein [Anoxybacillus gonensis]
TDLKVPLVGRVAYIGANFYKQIRLDPSFIKASDIAQDALMKGQVGQIDGIPLITVPSSYLPANVEFFITHPMATVAPIKLTDYVTHENPPGINGTLVEGRIRYDAFVFENKKNAIYVHKKA